MRPEHRVPTHPGEVLREEFLAPRNISQAALARHLGVAPTRIGDVVRQKRAVTADLAWLFAQALGTTPEFWTNLQTAHDLAKARPRKRTGRLRME